MPSSVRRWLLFSAATSLAFAPQQGFPAAAAPAPPEVRWDLTELYATSAPWDAAFDRTRLAVQRLETAS
jgi:hypothetical protein